MARLTLALAAVGMFMMGFSAGAVLLFGTEPYGVLFPIGSVLLLIATYTAEKV